MGGHEEVQLVGGPMDGTTAVVGRTADRVVYPVMRPTLTPMNLIEPAATSPDLSELVYVRSRRENADGRPVFEYRG